MILRSEPLGVSTVPPLAHVNLHLPFRLSNFPHVRQHSMTSTGHSVLQLLTQAKLKGFSLYAELHTP